MDEEKEENGVNSLRLTREQISSLGKAVGRNPEVEEVDLYRATDGRLVVRQVVKVERFKALKIG
jgi:hypothetical protein